MPGNLLTRHFLLINDTDLLDEKQLVLACQRHERSAQRELYEQFRAPLYSMCLRYARDAQEAEDFLHDGMIQVFNDIAKFRGEGALGGWVRRVVLNVLLQQIRRRPKLVSDLYLPEATTETDLEVELQQLSAAQIFALVLELPLGYRTVFNLYYLEELSHVEIATQLGISSGASKSQLYKAKLSLRKLIQLHFPTYQYRNS